MSDSWEDHPIATTDSWDDDDFDVVPKDTPELDQLKNAIDELRLKCDRQEKQIDALCLRCDSQEQQITEQNKKIAYLEKKQIGFRPPQAPRRSHITWDPKPKEEEEAKPVTKPVTKPVVKFGSKISFKEFEKTGMASLPQPKETRENPKEEDWQVVKSQRRVPKKEDNILHGSFKFWSPKKPFKNQKKSFGFLKADDGSEYYCDSWGLGSSELLDLLESNGWFGKRFRFSLVELERGGVMRTFADNVELA